MVSKRAFKIVWDRNALDHFKDILSYLSQQSNVAPKIVRKAVLEKLSIIKAKPFICEKDKLKDPSDNNYRVVFVFNYRITYFVNVKRREIQIIRIRHTRQEPMGY